MLFETITWKDATAHVCISEFNNSKHIGREDLLKLSNSCSEHVLGIQFFNSTLIVDEIHLLSAAQNAFNAFKGEYMRARTLDLEIAIFASAQPQIGVALDLMGVTDGTVNVGVIVVDEKKKTIERCMSRIQQNIGPEVLPAFAMTEAKMEDLMATFRISEAEMRLFYENNDLISRQQALSKCLVSRISQVAITG